MFKILTMFSSNIKKMKYHYKSSRSFAQAVTQHEERLKTKSTITIASYD
jgi:hypothetical protein